MRTAKDKPRKRSGARRALRWTRNILLGLVGFVAFVLITAYAVFSSNWGQEKLRATIESKMNDAFIGGAKIGGLEGNPFSELVLKDLVINGPDKQAAISVKRLTIKLPLLPLISNQLRVDKIIADDLDLLVKKDAEGKVNLANLMKPSKPSTWTIKLPNVQVHRGHVRLEGFMAEPVDLDNIELHVDAALPFGGPVDAGAWVSANWRQKQLPIDIATRVHIDQEVSRIETMFAQVGDIDVTMFQVRVPKTAFAMPIGGVVLATAPERTVELIQPTLDLPGDVHLFATAEPDGRLTKLRVDGIVGPGNLQFLGQADLQWKLASGVLTANALDLDTLTKGKLDGHGRVVATFDLDASDSNAEFPTVNALFTLWGQTGKSPETRAIVSLSTGGQKAEVALTARTNTGIDATADVAIRKQGERITLERGSLIATAADARRATQGMAPLRGSLSANLQASGVIAPKPDLAVAGYASGKRLRMQDISARAFDLRVDARHLPSRPVGTARVQVVDLKRADMEFGKLTVAAGNRPDGKLQVSVRSEPKQAPWLVDLDALVTTGDTVVVDLQRHLVRAAGGSVWKGETGQLTIGKREIALHDFETRSGDGSIRAALTFVRAGRDKGDLTAKVQTHLDLGNIEKLYKGKVDATVDIARVNNRFSGSIAADAKGFSLNPKMVETLDGSVRIKAEPGKLVANVDIGTLKTGSAKIALDIHAPKDLTNAAAWRVLDRNAIHNAAIELDDLKLDKLAKIAGAQPMEGTVDGKITLDPREAGGVIAIRGVKTNATKDLGTITADLRIDDASRDELTATLQAHLQPNEGATAAKDVTQNGAARFFATARFRTPDRLFDPVAWNRLGAGAFRGGEMRAERLAFHPGTLERLGIVSDLRGELAIGAELDGGMDAARFSVKLHQLRGGLLAQPVAIDVSGAIDQKSSRLVATVVGDNVTLLKVTGHIPVTLAELRASSDAAKTAPLTANIAINQVPAVSLLNVLGTSQVTGGMLDGAIKVGGTVDRPLVDAKITARDVTVPPESGEPTQGIKLMTIVASWNGEAGKLAIDGDQSAGGKLVVRATGSPSDLANVTASIDAKKVDIAPLVAFMPGPAGGLGGRMNASFRLKGADPKTADLSGNLRIEDGRIPIAPAVGTLFKGDVKLDIKNNTVNLSVGGKLGRGDVMLVATAPLDGATPKSGKLALKLRKVQIIGTTQPIISGTITADLARVDDIWQSNMYVHGLTVKVPSDKGNELSPVGRPNDLVYGGEKIHHGKNKGKDVPPGITHDHTGAADFKAPSQVEGPVAKRKAPGVPVAWTKISIKNVFVESNEVRGLVGGNLKVTIGDNKEVGIVGRVALTRGVVELFSRRYQVDKANLNFDGSPDPMLDVRIMHDFPEVTTVTEVRGRMSKPQLILSSNPGQYSQAELLGFLLGGEPGGDPENAPSASERVAGAGASFLSNKVGGYVKKALPVDIDVLRYEAASSTSSAAVTVGTWVTDTLFLAYRRHLEARPDENAGEGEVEYWIRRRLVLEAVAGDRGINGLDLLWRRRW